VLRRCRCDFGGGIALNRSGQGAIANLLLAVLAVPGLLYGFLLLLVLLLQPDWK
jgi:hypothetical protein